MEVNLRGVSLKGVLSIVFKCKDGDEKGAKERLSAEDDPCFDHRGSPLSLLEKIEKGDID
ncbi:hypothetical protein HY227_02875 [Candidatus Wolfebacteria bacterium]|nr:hypothetical protein [Candidatus Wolfebacteria bacterium]